MSTKDLIERLNRQPKTRTARAGVVAGTSKTTEAGEVQTRVGARVIRRRRVDEKKDVSELRAKLAGASPAAESGGGDAAARQVVRRRKDPAPAPAPAPAPVAQAEALAIEAAAPEVAVEAPVTVAAAPAAEAPVAEAPAAVAAAADVSAEAPAAEALWHRVALEFHGRGAAPVRRLELLIRLD